MFENIVNFFKKLGKQEKEAPKSKDAAKERLQLVLLQDRANVSADFLDLMKQEIIEVIKKYIDVDENAIDVRITNQTNKDGTNGEPALYANIPIVSIKEEMKNEVVKEEIVEKEEEEKPEQKVPTEEQTNNTISEIVEKVQEMQIEEEKENKQKEERNEEQTNKGEN